MVPDSKRLKRGLKDISPLFDQEGKVETCLQVAPLPRMQSLSAICPGDLAQNSFLNLFLASQMQTFLGANSAVISVSEEKKAAGDMSAEMHRVKRFLFSLGQLDDLCSHESKPSKNLGSSTFVFDFNYANPLHFKKVLPLLDKWVLFMKPELESLSEGYKYIKASLPLNRSLEYFAVYYGPENPKKAAAFYEKFSDIVSRRLGVGVTWLGEYDSAMPTSARNGLSYEVLQMSSSLDTLEKRALTSLVYPNLGLSG